MMGRSKWRSTDRILWLYSRLKYNSSNKNNNNRLKESSKKQQVKSQNVQYSEIEVIFKYLYLFVCAKVISLFKEM